MSEYGLYKEIHVWAFMCSPMQPVTIGRERKAKEGVEMLNSKENEVVIESPDIKDIKVSYEEQHFSIINKIMNNYQNAEQSIVNQLSIETPNHHLTTGTYREGVWKSLFEMIIPHKFYIDQGVFIIDSFGNISQEVDLAIFDETYTPYIFNYGKIKFIPIEAVAVAIQCKSKNVQKKEDIQSIKEWVKRIKALKPSLNSVVRIISEVVDNGKKRTRKQGKTQTSTRPILILCSTKEGKLYANAEKDFDITLNIDKNKLRKTIDKEADDYKYWCEDLNHYELSRYGNGKNAYEHEKGELQDIGRQLKNLQISDEDNENVIMSLTFQLNQLLMLINNPMQFPHQAYVNMFNEVCRKCKKVKSL